MSYERTITQPELLNRLHRLRRLVASTDMAAKQGITPENVDDAKTEASKKLPYLGFIGNAIQAISTATYGRDGGGRYQLDAVRDLTFNGAHLENPNDHTQLVTKLGQANADRIRAIYAQQYAHRNLTNLAFGAFGYNYTEADIRHRSGIYSAGQSSQNNDISGAKDKEGLMYTQRIVNSNLRPLPGYFADNFPKGIPLSGETTVVYQDNGKAKEQGGGFIFQHATATTPEVYDTLCQRRNLGLLPVLGDERDIEPLRQLASAIKRSHNDPEQLSLIRDEAQRFFQQRFPKLKPEQQRDLLCTQYTNLDDLYCTFPLDFPMLFSFRRWMLLQRQPTHLAGAALTAAAGTTVICLGHETPGIAGDALSNQDTGSISNLTAVGIALLCLMVLYYLVSFFTGYYSHHAALPAKEATPTPKPADQKDAADCTLM